MPGAALTEALIAITTFRTVPVDPDTLTATRVDPFESCRDAAGWFSTHHRDGLEALGAKARRAS